MSWCHLSAICSPNWKNSKWNRVKKCFIKKISWEQAFVGFLKSEGLENDYWFVFAYKFSREYSRSEKCGQDVKICTFYTSIFKIFCTFIIHFQRTVKQEEKGDLLNKDDWRVINVLLWQVQYDLMSRELKLLIYQFTLLVLTFLLYTSHRIWNHLWIIHK